MNKVISVYELLGLIKDNIDKEIYCNYIDNNTGKENTMWACVENIVDRLDNKSICLNDKVKVAIFDEDKPTIEKLNLDREPLRGREVPRAIDYLLEGKINEIIDKLEKEKELKEKPKIEKISINGKDIHKLEELGIYDIIEDIESILNEIIDKIEKESK